MVRSTRHRSTAFWLVLGIGVLWTHVSVQATTMMETAKVEERVLLSNFRLSITLTSSELTTFGSEDQYVWKTTWLDDWGYNISEWMIVESNPKPVAEAVLQGPEVTFEDFAIDSLVYEVWKFCPTAGVMCDAPRSFQDGSIVDSMSTLVFFDALREWQWVWETNGGGNGGGDPMPEPGVALLFAAGLFGLAAESRRRRKVHASR